MPFKNSELRFFLQKMLTVRQSRICRQSVQLRAIFSDQTHFPAFIRRFIRVVIQIETFHFSKEYIYQ